MHAKPHSMPPGLLSTTPVPSPFFRTDSRKSDGAPATKVAVTLRERFIVTVQRLASTESQPFQLANWPSALSVTTWSDVVNTSEQSLPQSIPAGVLITLPVPVPASNTFSVCGGGGGGAPSPKNTSIVLSASRRTEHVSPNKPLIVSQPDPQAENAATDPDPRAT